MLRALLILLPALALAQTGVSDDRVSLPEGPGSLEGVGENVKMSGNMGTMTWGHPIVVTPGFPGVTPGLSLNYNSGGGSGVVGIGWSLGGVPMVKRNTWRGLPRYDEGDDFVADEGQLVRVADEPPTYRARFEKGFVRYVWLDAGDGSNGYWRADYPDGSQGFFGATAEGVLVPTARASDPARGGTYEYCLVEKVDVFGHRMRFTWTKDGTYPLLQSVGYVYPDGAEAPTYQVTLRYEDREDDSGRTELSNALGGFDLRLTQRLREISVFARGQRIRRYRLEYEDYDSSGGFTRLTRIERLGQRDEVYPIGFDFTYSRALGGLCGGGECPGPFMVDMGSIGVGLEGGRTNLVDINGDGLPDVVHSELNERHVFFINEPDPEGGSAFGEMTRSQFGDANWMLDSGYTQLLDSNGDGFADLINSRSGRVLFNEGQGDWVRDGELGDTAALPDFDLDFEVGDTELGTIRFLDYDHDKRIDVLRATRASTDLFRNVGGGGFARDEAVEALGAGIQDDNLKFSDMNGDGLLDPVKLLPGAISFRLNLGRGRWTEWRDIAGAELEAEDLPFTALEDLNGDGLADLVTVRGTEVHVSLNRSGNRFFSTQTFTAEDVDGEIPARIGGTSVLFADMNANGSTDVVWIGREGQVDYLELYPIRPNLLSRIENNIGMVMDVSYGTSVQHLARSEAGWDFPLPHPMLVVDTLDVWDRLSMEHELHEFEYADGFYDGREKQFRGYQAIVRRSVGDAAHLDGRAIETYNVGDGDPYEHGLLEEVKRYSAEDLIRTESTGYADCAVDGVPAELPRPSEELEPLAVRWQCKTRSETIHQEGLAEAEWKTTASTYAYDGYGNVTHDSQLGVVGECEACDRDASIFGAPCGPECLGDELHTVTTFIPPGERWLLRKASEIQRYGRAGDLTAITQNFYDGDDFVGLPGGQVAEGKLTRVRRKVSDGHWIDTDRSAFDGDGNVVHSLDPLGEADGSDHRRSYVYDPEGLRITRTELWLDDYRLRRETSYEALFDKVSESTAWMRVVDGDVLSSPRSKFFTYDQHGRLQSRVLPGGDTLRDASEVYQYQLRSPVSALTVRRRSVVGGPLDLESVRCLDGRGRALQTRRRISAGVYQVDGFKRYEHHDAPEAVYQPYLSDSPDCDRAAPEDTLARHYFYDGLHRRTGTIEADAGIYGEASRTRTVYRPLAKTIFDAEDTDPESPHHGTPTTERVDGLQRLIRIERSLVRGAVAPTRLRYDSLGRLRGYVDAAGNEKVQTFDLMGRVLRIEDPNAGDLAFRYDDASKLTHRTDARGEVLAQAFDGQNRIAARWDGAAPQASRIEWTYDHVPECPPEACTNSEGLAAQVTWPGGIDRRGYDGRGRRILESRALDGVTYVTATVYDNVDRPVARHFPDGRTLRTRFDAASRVLALEPVIESARYDHRSQLVEVQRSDGTEGRWSHDDLMRLSRLETRGPEGLLQANAFSRNRAGKLRGIEDTSDFEPSAAAEVEVDAWYRPVGVAYEAESLALEFDEIDNLNRLTASEPRSLLNHGELGYAPDRPNALEAVGETMLAYDAAGNRLNHGAAELHWDYQGRLVGVGEDVYRYGATAGRVSKDEAGSRTHYGHADFEVRDGISAVYARIGRARVARLESAALATAWFTDHNRSEDIDAGDAWLEDGDPTGILMSSARRLLIEAGPAIAHLHSDHLGNITLATDGDLLGKRQFYPTGLQRPGAAGHVDVHGFTGQEQDRSGLLAFRYRSLDPVTGRWLSVDPAFLKTSTAAVRSLGEGTTAYAYVANDHLNRVDPWGLNSHPARFNRVKFNKTLVNKTWREAKTAKGGGKRCPTCPRKIAKTRQTMRKGKVKTLRGYDIDHGGAIWHDRVKEMQRREAKTGRQYTRREVIKIHSMTLRAQCVSCNRGHGEEPEPADAAKWLKTHVKDP